MEQIDLNIENYNLDDILDLFSIPADFSEGDLRLAKKVVLKMHPDKSRLDKKYFLFFCAAYKLLYRVYEVRNKRTRCTEYKIDENEEDLEKQIILEKFQKVSGKDFNKRFNEMFEKAKIKTEDDEGYGDWLKSEEGLDTRKTTKNNMNAFFDKKKMETRALITTQGVSELGSGTYHSSLTGDRPEYYSSDVFGSLQYDDIKRAHVESVVPVTHEDYTKTKQFSNANDLAAHRNRQSLNPLGLDQANKYLKERAKQMNDEHISTAYKLAKQEEDIKKANDGWWGTLRRLTNG